MDAIDWKIIRALRRNARITNQDLANEVGLSPSPCLRRVRALEDTGIIKGYTVRVDMEKLGFPVTAFLSVRLLEQTDASLSAFEKGIRRFEEVQDCYLMSGARDYLIRIVTRSLSDYERFVREELTKLPGIASLETSFALGQVKGEGDLSPRS